MTSLALLAADAHAGFPSRAGTPRVRRARAALAKALWRRDGARRLPGERALDEALRALPEAELAWVCEFAPLGPLYLLPTRRFVGALAQKITALGARRVVEVAAGDGFLSAALQRAMPGVEVIATDSGAWAKPEARMSAKERRAHAKVAVPGVRAGAHVRRVGALRAVETLAPDVVLASWLPPGTLLDRLIRSKTRYVLEVGAAGDVTAGPWSWRFAHDTCDGPIEESARCRLDARPGERLHSRVTLYFGGAHEEHGCERVRPGDWLWQFRPTRG
jgi:hypothetical protein